MISITVFIHVFVCVRIGIECSVEMAAAQVQLVTAQKKYEKLLQRKNQLSSQD